MKTRKPYIAQLLSLLLLFVFSISQLPVDLFHGHEDVVHVTASEGKCLHKGHIQSKKAHCILCTVHVEKTLAIDKFEFEVFLHDSARTFFTPAISGSYTELVSTGLRGPPVTG